MAKDHESFRTINNRRMILVADDEAINREMLGSILLNDYEILYAEDGADTMNKIRENRETLSLVLLDVLMPVMSGLEVLKAVKADETLSRIPVIVTTVERETEIESLQLGAIDFIPKPYPAEGVVRARIQRTIELYEDRDIIQFTERDELTGLYNKEYFLRYVGQLDQHHKEQPMDALILDINHFRMINERYGRAYGDEVLRKLGRAVLCVLEKSGGIAGRREADTFLVYCPHRDDYAELLEKATDKLLPESSAENRVRLRLGVYSNVDKSIEIERRFDRAKMAADIVRGNLSNNIGYYDDQLHQRQIYAEQLIEDFPAAIAGNQFQVYYQPKFDVRPDTPVLASAEALVRWTHPVLGMISPGVFIPLFEDNGLIRQLDDYVWREAARQIREWKDRLGCFVPVSVNVSRIDMYDPELSGNLTGILREQDLEAGNMMLEVTESAYTQDSAQIIGTVEKLRSLGFRIEMDDFGTGYSSLNMISNLPVDALKLDMQFIRNAFRDGGNTHMLEVIISISKYLSVPVIAEGVETEEQLHALKALGCEFVQGYFFSKPVPAGEFEPFILQKREAELAEKERMAETAAAGERAQAFGEAFAYTDTNAAANASAAEQSAGPEAEVQRAGTAGEDGADPAADGGEQEAIHHHAHMGIQLKTAALFFVLLAVLAAFALMIANISVTRGYRRMELASDRYISAQLAASDMESGSDYLTDRVRCYVVTGESRYLKDFIQEVEVTRTRDKAVENLEILLEGKDSNALESLNTALKLSNELIGTEHKAMRLMLETGEVPADEVPAEIAEIELTPEEKAMSPEELKNTAQTMVFDNNYMHYKDRIRENVRLCTQSLIRSSSQELEQASAQLSFLNRVQTVLTVLFLVIVLGIVALIMQQVLKPLTNMVHEMQAKKSIVPTGVEELRFVTRTYNRILKENEEAQERLSHEASHDALTGLFNRGAYDLLMESADREHMALILIDVDYFKTVNDIYGHVIGDRVLKRVAEILRHSFRSVDILCRIGGDEFVVVMTRVNSSMSQLVLNKIRQVNELLQHPKDDLPPVSLSVGVAFSDRKNPKGDIFKDADTALYRVKEAGRKGCMIFE